MFISSIVIYMAATGLIEQSRDDVVNQFLLLIKLQSIVEIQFIYAWANWTKICVC